MPVAPTLSILNELDLGLQTKLLSEVRTNGRRPDIKETLALLTIRHLGRSRWNWWCSLILKVPFPMTVYPLSTLLGRRWPAPLNYRLQGAEHGPRLRTASTLELLMFSVWNPCYVSLCLPPARRWKWRMLNSLAVRVVTLMAICPTFVFQS